MSFPKLSVKIERESADGDVFLVRSPAVGIYSHHPEPSSCLTGGSRAGRLLILNRTYDLVLPGEMWGQVESLAVDEKVEPVEYGQLLFYLAQRGIQAVGRKQSQAGVAASAAAEGTYPVTSPTDGIFYSKPNPDAPPFVNVGDRVKEGQALGLVEVMKCFNPIQYGGSGLPPEAEIINILAQDGAEIKAQEILFLVREVASAERRS